VAISADGEYLAAGSWDNNVYLFDKDSGTPLWNYNTGDGVRSVAISKDGEYIAAGSWDNNVYLFDKGSSTPLWSYTTDDYVVSVTISADGEYIAAGSYDGKVYLFGKDSSAPLWTYTTGAWVNSVAISADGKYIAAGSYDDKVYLFDRGNSTPLWSYTTDNWVESVAISADSEYIVAGSTDHKVYLFDKDSSTPLWSYQTGSIVYSVAISADGEYIAAGSGWGDHKTYLFDEGNSTGGPPVAYSISFSDANVNLDVRPGASGVGCTELLISNEGTATIDVDVSMSGGGVTISPGAVSVTLEAGANITTPICAVAATSSNHTQVQVTAIAQGREANTQLNEVNKSGGFTVTVLQYVQLSIRADQPYQKICRDSILDVSFTVINYGNDVDTIQFEIINQEDLENAGFTVEQSQPLMEIVSQGESEMTVQITVTDIVEEGIYNLIARASTTLAGETEARSVIATLEIRCDGIRGIPAPSLAASVAAVAVIALRRPRKA
jgi:outer membrane protein assembly factor BamB